MTAIVSPADESKRLDVFVAECAEISRSAASRLIEDGLVTVGGVVLPKRYAVKAGDEIEVDEPSLFPMTSVTPENIPLDIVYEDADIIVINKPSGMVVHPAPGNMTGTLVHALLYHCGDSLSGIGGVLRPGIVHRIDKDTSGLLVVAKNDKAHAALSAQLSGHHIEREYHALVTGHLRETDGTVDAPIGRHPVDRKKMAVIKDDAHTARAAVTHYHVLEEMKGASYVRLLLETGRTHQIRVHMSYIGHPLLGDVTYGGGKTPFEKSHASLLDGQMLHAKRLSFVHPTTGESVSFTCPLPDNFEKMLSLLRKESQ